MEIKPTNLRSEILAGISTFLAAFYIIIVNPAILAEAGMPFSGALTATMLLEEPVKFSFA
jgi:AGZA family xanthine/uracil permease-like MFS transporter